MAQICNTLIRLRKKHKLSQEEVAKHIGVTKRTYAGYETGKHKPNLESIIKLANLYKITIDFMIMGFK